MRITEFFQVLPPLLLAMVLVLLFSPSLVTIAIAIGVVSWTSTARLARGEFLRIRELEYVKGARSIGSRNGRIIWRVILPNAAPPLIVSAALSVGVAILFEAGLSFLELNDPNIMSWGYMIGSNRPGSRSTTRQAAAEGARIGAAWRSCGMPNGRDYSSTPGKREFAPRAPASPPATPAPAEPIGIPRSAANRPDVTG